MSSFAAQYNIKYYSPYFWIGQCTQSYTAIQEKLFLFLVINMFLFCFVCLFVFFVFVIFLQNLLDYDV